MDKRNLLTGWNALSTGLWMMPNWKKEFEGSGCCSKGLKQNKQSGRNSIIIINTKSCTMNIITQQNSTGWTLTGQKFSRKGAGEQQI